MIQISISEFKADTEKYVRLAQETDVYIAVDGKAVAKLVSAKPDKKEAFASFLGLFPEEGLNIDHDAARDERIIDAESGAVD